MSNLPDGLHFVDNPVARGERYTTIEIDVGAVLDSWRASLFSYEWILPDGRIKALQELPPGEQPNAWLSRKGWRIMNRWKNRFWESGCWKMLKSGRARPCS